MKKPYIKESLLNELNLLKIERIGDLVITKYKGDVIKTSTVSNRYEVFDIVGYIKEKLETIEKNFKIDKYSLSIKGGVQYLKLYSDKIVINNIDFYKTFYITNSTDKSRRLSFKVGLYTNLKNIDYINSNELDFSKKHLSGVNKLVEESFNKLDEQIFTEQIESLRSLDKHIIKLSNIKEVITTDNEKIGNKRFVSFKNKVLFNGLFDLTDSERKELFRNKTDILYDFELDAFKVLLTYLSMFSYQDSVIIKKESARILELTKFMIRKKVLSKIFDL
jgi:hypothetical protein